MFASIKKFVRKAPRPIALVKPNLNVATTAPAHVACVVPVAPCSAMVPSVPSVEQMARATPSDAVILASKVVDEAPAATDLTPAPQRVSVEAASITAATVAETKASIPAFTLRESGHLLVPATSGHTIDTVLSEGRGTNASDSFNYSATTSLGPIFGNKGDTGLALSQHTTHATNIHNATTTPPFPKVEQGMCVSHRHTALSPIDQPPLSGVHPNNETAIVGSHRSSTYKPPRPTTPPPAYLLARAKRGAESPTSSPINPSHTYSSDLDHDASKRVAWWLNDVSSALRHSTSQATFQVHPGGSPSLLRSCFCKHCRGTPTIHTLWTDGIEPVCPYRATNSNGKKGEEDDGSDKGQLFSLLSRSFTQHLHHVLLRIA